MYQVVINDIQIRETTKYMSTEKENQFLIKMMVLDEGKQIGQGIGCFASQKWFNGGKSMSPSKLYLLFTAVYGHYYEKVDISKWDASMVNTEAVNDLIGKQLRISVQLQTNGKNKITTFLPIKKELPIPARKDEPPITEPDA